MAGRMLTLAPTESCSLWTTIMVAPVLAMITSPASHCVKCTEAGSSDLSAGIESATPRPQLLKRFSGTSLTDGILEIGTKHVKDHPDKRFERIFIFTADRVDEDFEVESNTPTQTISCSNPPTNLKSLAAEIENGFGIELDAVKIIVTGNDLEMKYREEPLFKAKMEAAERYIKFAVHVARNQWLTILQRQLRINSESGMMRARLSRRLTSEKLEMEEFSFADEVAANRIWSKLVGTGRPRSRFGRLWDDQLSTDWAIKLTGELIHIWFESSIRTSRWSRFRNPKVTFKCPGFSAENITVEKVAATSLNVYALIIQEYICSQLDKHTSSDGHEPAVIIRMTNKRDDTFLMGPSGKEPYIPFTGKAEGKWVSISVADESGPGRIYLCQSSNFHATFSEFLRENYIAKSGSKGENQAHNGSGTLNVPRLVGPRKRKASTPRHDHVEVQLSNGPSEVLTSH